MSDISLVNDKIISFHNYYNLETGNLSSLSRFEKDKSNDMINQRSLRPIEVNSLVYNINAKVINPNRHIVGLIINTKI